MYYIECPKCEYENEIEADELPDTTSDLDKRDCENCGHEYKFGWNPVLEIRG